jgi:hypothetical protein
VQHFVLAVQVRGLGDEQFDPVVFKHPVADEIVLGAAHRAKDVGNPARDQYLFLLTDENGRPVRIVPPRRNCGGQTSGAAAYYHYVGLFHIRTPL